MVKNNSNSGGVNGVGGDSGGCIDIDIAVEW